MKIDIAKHERMSQTGSSLIKLIQNNNVPSLDLLVRESIQNSTDATIDNGKGSVNVDFNIIEFKSKSLSKYLEGIENTLNERIKERTSKLIEIRDSNTTGLKGPIQYSEVKNNDFGNLLKLIYEISQPQQGEGAGGSWGLGKTVYFRIGIGLVIYYTRIKEDGIYKSRLAACLVEDEKDKKALLREVKCGSNIERGIAWWGEIIPGEENSRPITDEKKIEDILNNIGIKTFKNNETGTSVIIPYINEKELLKEVLFEQNSRLENTPYWVRSIEEYLNIAIQRWYAVRLDNKNFSSGRWLKATINGEVLEKDSMLPLFKLIQELYNCSDRAIKNEKNLDMIEEKNIKVSTREIFLNNIFNKGRLAGKVYFTEVDECQMSMGIYGYEKSPIAQINNLELKKDTNDPIITFIRKPGMCINYESSGSPWTSGIPKSEQEKYIVGLFIPNSDNTITEKNETITLEEYMRRSENADHMSWNDWTFNGKNHSIVRKIQNHVTNKISSEFIKKENKQSDVLNRGLGIILGDELLPPLNFGRRPTIPRQNKYQSLKRSKPIKKASFQMLGEPILNKNKTTIYYELKIPKKKGEYFLEIIIVTENGHVDALSWEDKGQIGGGYPITLKEFSVFKAQRIKSKKELLSYIELSKNNKFYESDYLKIELIETKGYSTPYGILISVLDDIDVVIEGQLTFEYARRDLQIEISLKEKGE